MGLGFRALGLGFRVLGFGLRVFGLGFGVLGLGLRDRRCEIQLHIHHGTNTRNPDAKF